MDDQSPESLYNDFIRYLLEETDTDIQQILFGTAHWPSALLQQGTLSSANVIVCLHRLKDCDADMAFLCSTLLYVLCADHRDCVKKLESQNDTALWTAIPFISLCQYKMDVKTPMIAQALEQIGSEWETAFFGSMIMFAFSEFLLSRSHADAKSLPLDPAIFVHYVAMLTMLYEPLMLEGKTVDRTIVQDLAQFDLTGLKMTTVGNSGAQFGQAFLCCMDSPDIMARCRNVILSVEGVDHPYAKLIYRPFYKFGTPQRVYDMVDRLADVADTVNLEDDTVNDCAICMEAQTSLKLVPCDHKMCAQCLNRLFRTTTNTACPYCRSDIENFEQL
jgi:hypothetical protein